MKPVIVLPAAGRSARMRGRDKLLETIDGQPLIQRQAQRALGTGCHVIVALPPDDETRAEALKDIDVQILIATDAAEGMGATLRHAAREMIDTHANSPMMILLPDVPGIRTTDINAVIQAFEANNGQPTRATDADQTPGTPLIVNTNLIPQFTKLAGDDGGRSILSAQDVHLVPLADDRATRDLDTPEAWAAWRAETGITA